MVEISLQNLVTTFLQVDVPMILAGSNLGRKPVAKTRTSKDSFKTVKKNLYQHNLYKKSALRKQIQIKLILFYIKHFPKRTLQTNPSLILHTPPKKSIYQKNKRNIYKQLFHKNSRPKIAKIFLTTKI